MTKGALSEASELLKVGGMSFFLKKNPGVYGPMPGLRISLRYRIEEARRMGWWLGLGMTNTQDNEKELQKHEKENTTS